MRRARALIGVGLLAAVCVPATGCNMLYELQPHRLQRLNRAPPEHKDPYNWSIPDPPLPAVTPSDADR